MIQGLQEESPSFSETNQFRIALNALSLPVMIKGDCKTTVTATNKISCASRNTCRRFFETSCSITWQRTREDIDQLDNELKLVLFCSFFCEILNLPFWQIKCLYWCKTM